jgi:hypothetical protein
VDHLGSVKRLTLSPGVVNICGNSLTLACCCCVVAVPAYTLLRNIIMRYCVPLCWIVSLAWQGTWCYACLLAAHDLYQRATSLVVTFTDCFGSTLPCLTYVLSFVGFGHMKMSDGTSLDSKTHTVACFISWYGCAFCPLCVCLVGCGKACTCCFTPDCLPPMICISERRLRMLVYL